MKAAVVSSLIGLLGACVSMPTDLSNVPEENFGFLAVADGRCIPKIGAKLSVEQQSECRRTTEPRRYRGTWLVGFETSIFTPAGKPTCIEGVTLDYCPDLILEGKALPWPSRWACMRSFEVDFIGRRSAWPGSYGGGLDYRLIVDRVISAKRLPDPPSELGECDAAAP